MDIQKMTIEEKLALLSEKNKAYVLGFIERSLLEARQQEKKTEKETASNATAAGKK
jgi:hypothetical protein